MAQFKHFDLRFVVPKFDSSLTDLIIELDYLRKKTLFGSTPPLIFFQLKNIFHMVESIASARIEGNITTVAEYVETKIKPSKEKDYNILEIQNMEKCLQFIEDNINELKIDRAFVSELHKIVIKDLPTAIAGEGDSTPGVYRLKPIRIAGSSLTPPEPATVPSYMDELFVFIDRQDEPKYDLLKAAIAHHRFVWIHPFNNGNGRTVRMLTYAMLVKYGFNVNQGRIINPAAIFCNNREEYYNMLSLADNGTDESLLEWCEYVLNGLSREIKKIDNLLEYDYLKRQILIPTIDFSLERKWITELEYRVLRRMIDKKEVKAADLSDIIKSEHMAQRSRVIHRLREKKMVIPVSDNARKYAICLQNNYLVRGIVVMLLQEGLVPAN